MFSRHRCFDWAIASRARILHGDLEGRTTGAAGGNHRHRNSQFDPRSYADVHALDFVYLVGDTLFELLVQLFDSAVLSRNSFNRCAFNHGLALTATLT
jgi:hypothetical protein